MRIALLGGQRQRVSAMPRGVVSPFDYLRQRNDRGDLRSICGRLKCFTRSIERIYSCRNRLRIEQSCLNQPDVPRNIPLRLDVEAVARQLVTIVKANAALTDHHKARRATLTQ